MSRLTTHRRFPMFIQLSENYGGGKFPKVKSRGWKLGWNSVLASIIVSGINRVRIRNLSAVFFSVSARIIKVSWLHLPSFSRRVCSAAFVLRGEAKRKVRFIFIFSGGTRVPRCAFGDRATSSRSALEYK